MSQANAHSQLSAPATLPSAAPGKSSADLLAQRLNVKMPGEDLTIVERMRVMDVARELRDQRQTAEEMFRKDDARAALREKLMRTAQLSGDQVTEAEVDAAITQYFANLHAYQTPRPGVKKMIAYAWIWRGYLAMAAGTVVATAGIWLTFF